MKIKPILFSTPMVQAILEGRKTQTRRIVKPQPSNPDFVLWNVADSTNKSIIDKKYWGSKNQVEDYQRDNEYFLPKYIVGDILWVRETFINDACFDEAPAWVFKADNENYPMNSGSKWKPSIFMPKEACRLFLKVTNVRVEKLQDISEEDAILEGVDFLFNHKETDIFKNPKYYHYLDKEYRAMTAKSSFETLWQSINGKESWGINPFVWVYEFELTEKPNNF